MTTKKSHGFTVIELILVISIFSFASVLFFVQKNNLSIVNQDSQRKISINAIFYSLEEVYYPANGYYPQTVSSDNLKSVDPNLFTDPNGKSINTIGSNYSYKPLNCVNNKCKGYELRATLAKEADYVKSNRN